MSAATAAPSAPPMHAPWIWQIVGLVISSSQFHARSTSARNGRRPTGRRTGPPASPGPSGREHRAVAAHDHDSARSLRGGFAERVTEASHHLAVHGVSLLARVITTWRTAPRSSIWTSDMYAPAPKTKREELMEIKKVVWRGSADGARHRAGGGLRPAIRWWRARSTTSTCRRASGKIEEAAVRRVEKGKLEQSAATRSAAG